ncbi:MAG: RdgB/HAM1 family non-canonical purine NTP pyrophosphatase [Ignavibacteria bacterium]
MKILLATNNKDKVFEIKKIFTIPDLQLLTLWDLNLDIEINEDQNTLEGNAIKKAKTIFEISGIPSVADDTGLFVEILNGAPGVFSSRYAGNDASYEDNCKKLLQELEPYPDDKRIAYFKTIVCYYFQPEKYLLFDGICKGRIASQPRGKNGFGYDPIFIPQGEAQTYAEMSVEQKNLISHRNKAFSKFNDYLYNLKHKHTF